MTIKIKNPFRLIKRYLQKYLYVRKLIKINLIVPTDEIILNYGEVFQKAPNELIHGGKVKLLHFQKNFPESCDRFNILYLVSSAHPLFAQELIGWAKKHGAKIVLNQNGVAYPAWAGSFTQSQNAVLKALIHQADYVIYQSKFCRSSANYFLGPVSVPSEVLYNCVDIGLFSPPKTEIPSTPWTLLSTGTHQQAERVLIVLQTIAVLKERKKTVNLILTGRLDWPQAEDQVQETIRRLGIKEQVTILPPYTQDEAPFIYQRAHLLLHIKYKDPCPTVVLEAMACGLPVIGSNSGGMPELVGEDGGILLDVPESWERMHYPSADKIADAVELIFSDLKRWQYKARERAIQFFDKDSWINRHREIFGSMMKDHG